MRGIVFAAALVLVAHAAAAEPPADCHDPRWIAAAHQAEGYDCTQIATRDVAGADGAVYRVRAVRDRNSDTRETDNEAPLLLDAIAHALKVYDGLGLPIGHVSLVLYPKREVAEMGAGRETGAAAPLPAARAAVYGPRECLVLIPLAGFTAEQTKAYALELRYMAAHLVVHCIQAWRWPIERDGALASDAWWVEGGAEALASAAEPLDRVTQAFVAAFDRDSPTIALTAFAYEASPFFMWLRRAYPERFEALLRCAARSPATQTQCLVTMAKPDALNAFARAYLQRQIVTLRGQPVPVAPEGGGLAKAGLDGAALSADVAVTTLWRGRLKLGSGRWTISGDRPLAVSGVLGSRGWQSPGAALTIPCGGGEVLVYAMPTAAAEQRFTISARRTADATCPGG